MKNYERRIVLTNNELAEGVYAASGDSCYATIAKIHQKPETGRGDYRIQVDAHHDTDHNSNCNQCLHITFNQAVVYKSCNGNGATLESGDGTTALTIGLTYWNNHTDNIGFGDLVVESDAGLAITGAWMEDRAKQY